MEPISQANGNDNVYTIQHKGLLTLDKFLIAFCVGVIPGFIGVLANRPTLTGDSKFWAALLIYFDTPTLFCFAWHSFRWPVRMKVMDERVHAAVKDWTDDMIHYVDNVVGPKGREVIKGLSHEGEDGKAYVNRKQAVEQLSETWMSGLSSDNPIMKNLMHSHSIKIAEANRHSAGGILDERFARIKQIADQFSRYARYWLLIAVVICAVKFCLSFLR